MSLAKSPVAVREPVTDKDLTPPARLEHPKADLNIQPKASKADVADRSKEEDSLDKDKSDKDKNKPTRE